MDLCQEREQTQLFLSMLTCGHDLVHVSQPTRLPIYFNCKSFQDRLVHFSRLVISFNHDAGWYFFLTIIVVGCYIREVGGRLAIFRDITNTIEV